MVTNSYMRKEYRVFRVRRSKLFLSNRRIFLDLKKTLDKELYNRDYLIIHINFKLLKIAISNYI